MLGMKAIAMRNFIRISVAVCLLATVASAAPPQSLNYNANLLFPGNVTATITAAGLNGQMKGRGQLRLFRTAVYPITVTSATLAEDMVTIAGFIKRQGLLYPFDLNITRSTGEAELEISDVADTAVVTTLDGIVTTARPNRGRTPILP